MDRSLDRRVAAGWLAVSALFRVVRHPLRSTLLLSGYLIVVLLFLPPLNEPASAIGLRLRLAIVEGRYRPAAESLIRADHTASTRAGLVQDQRIRPDSGRVVLGPDGDPELVVWTWTEGLAIGHPSGLVFDPNRRLGEGSSSFQEPAPGGISLQSCEPLTAVWWWCVLYD